MSVMIQWVLLLIALLPLTYAVIKGKELSIKQFLAIMTFTVVIFLFIDTKGTIGVHKSIDILVNIVMWATIIGLSALFVYLKDIKRLAMVLFIPGFVFVIRLIDAIFSKVGI
jgi:hypothetical protein